MQAVMMGRGNSAPFNTPTRINRRSMQSVGLVFWAPLNSVRPIDVISGQALTLIGTTTAFAGGISDRLCWNINGANGDGLYLDSTIVTATPLTLVTWGFSTSDTGNQIALSIGDTAANNEFFALRYSGNVAGDPIRAGATSAAIERLAATTTAYPINEWTHAVAVFTSPTNRAAYLNGGGKGTNATSNTPTSLDRIGIGYRATQTVGSNFQGYLADVRVYNRALSDNEIWQLYDPATRYELYEPTTPIWVVGAPAVTLYTQSVAGAISPAGAIAKRPALGTAGAISPTGAITKRVGKLLAGAISPTGAITKRMGKILAGAIGPTGALSAIRTVLVALLGAISPTGALLKRPAKLLAGSLAPSGAISKRLFVALAGAVGPNGIISKRVNKTLAGAIGPTGALNLVRSIIVAIGGAISPSGAISKRPRLTLTGSLDPAGALVAVLGGLEPIIKRVRLVGERAANHISGVWDKRKGLSGGRRRKTNLDGEI